MIEVAPVHGAELIEPVKLREKSLRDGEPVPDEFAAALRETVKAGELEVLVARAEGHMVGVAVLSLTVSTSSPGSSPALRTGTSGRTRGARISVGRC